MIRQLNIELRKKLVALYLKHYVVWLRDLGTTKIGAVIFGELRNVVLEVNGEVKWLDKVTNKDVLERIGEKRMFLNNILREKPIEQNIF